MQQTPIISIIIPVYNKDYALKHTLQSIQNQGLSDFEVLLIDDGSTDSSPIICDAFQKLDNRFVAIHKSNGGVSSARNMGLDMMRGKYVFFCDADDELPENALSALVSAQEKSGAELVIGGFAYKNINTGNIASPYTLVRSEMLLKMKELNQTAELLWRENNMLTACTRLFLADIIRENHIRFDESLIVLEDFDFVLSYLKYVKIIQGIKECSYFQILGYGVESFRAKVDYIDDIKPVYDKFIHFLDIYGIPQSDSVMKEINLVITEDLKKLSMAIPKKHADYRDRKKRSREIMSFPCVQQALKSVEWDENTQYLIDTYGIMKWLYGIAIQLKRIHDDYPIVRQDKGIVVSYLWKLKNYISLYI